MDFSTFCSLGYTEAITNVSWLRDNVVTPVISTAVNLDKNILPQKKKKKSVVKICHQALIVVSINMSLISVCKLDHNKYCICSSICVFLCVHYCVQSQC